MRYAAVNTLRCDYPVWLICKVLAVSSSGYYSWIKRGHPLYAQNSERLATIVMAAHSKTRETYGAVRLHKELLTEGHFITLWKVKQLRQKLGLCIQRKQRFVHTTDSNHALPVAKNVLCRDFSQSKCNREWVSDITYIPTQQGWLYLAGIKDLCSKEIVGFSLSARIDTELVVAALTNALQMHRPPPWLILHSDRGSQYCSNYYQAKLSASAMFCEVKLYACT